MKPYPTKAGFSGDRRARSTAAELREDRMTTSAPREIAISGGRTLKTTPVYDTYWRGLRRGAQASLRGEIKLVIHACE
jgi:hypothetical protein